MTETVSKAMESIAAIAAEMAKVGVGKGRENRDQHYKFRGIDDVVNALSPMLAEHKLVIIPRYSEREIRERVTASGKSQLNVSVAGFYTIRSAFDGSSVDVGPFYGEGQDFSDKATNKAMSAAYKYMATQTFCIPFEGMEDGDSETPEASVPRGAEKPKSVRSAQEEMEAREATLITLINNAQSEAEIDACLGKAMKTLAHMREHYPNLYRNIQARRQQRLVEIKSVADMPFPDERDPYDDDIPV